MQDPNSFKSIRAHLCPLQQNEVPVFLSKFLLHFGPCYVNWFKIYSVVLSATQSELSYYKPHSTIQHFHCHTNSQGHFNMQTEPHIKPPTFR